MSLLKFLKRHPFPVVAQFEQVVAVSFAFPETVLRPLVPDGLEIDTYEGFGFVTAAMVWTRNLRPAGFPSFLGQDFLLAGYRIFTRFNDDSGRRLRGLYILRSETDKRRMVWAGNLLTHYNYRHVHVNVQKQGEETMIKTFLKSGRPTLDVTFESSAKNADFPKDSPFHDWHNARRFAGPMPFTFSAEENGKFVVIEGNRQNWTPRPIHVRQWCVALFDEEPFRKTKPILANAFGVENIAYHWKKGRIAQPKGHR